MIRRICGIMVALFLTVTLSTCHNKELCEDHSHIHNVKVVFDWSNAPDANPKSVSAYFFSTSDGDAPGNIRYNFIGRNGGSIRLTSGYYSAIGMNNDHTDWAAFRGTDNIETFEIYTFDATMLSALGLDANSVPRARDTENERIATTPGMLWNNRQDGIMLNDEDGDHTITFYPEEAICHYTVTILDVENLKYLNGGSLDATLSGLAEGFYHGSHSPTNTPVTMPFEIKDNGTGNQLYAEFLTFGECSLTKAKHFLNVYMLFDDGTANFYTYDVTQQVASAPDPRHVNIVVRGLSLPKPITNGGGFRPSIDDWEEVTEDLDM